MSKKAIVITAGDPAGCGPFITLKAIEELNLKTVTFFVIGDKKIFERLALYRRLKKHITFIDVGIKRIEKIRKGRASPLSGQASLEYLNKALKLIKKKHLKRLVTAPLSKEAVGSFYPKFSGHTEYLANYFKVPQVAMMMVSKELKVVLLTRHIFLRDVSAAISSHDIIATLSLVYSSLKRQFKIRSPRIVFASLNPHAGINTFLEKEERLIYKLITHFRKRVYGPYPADTLFIKENLRQYDCVICPYHDQAMIPFKLLSIRKGVNVTLGLPIIRTSPAHGVAYDLMRQGKTPFHSAMVEAIRLALKLSV